MPTVFYVFLGFIIIFFAVNLIWRKCSLPCPAWLGWMVEIDNPIFRNDSARVIIEHLDLRPGMHVLDFGCGPGRLTIPAAKTILPAGEVTALDIQEKMLARVRAKAVQENLNVQRCCYIAC
jgi:tRNA A58 N-methylase Trm61